MACLALQNFIRSLFESFWESYHITTTIILILVLTSPIVSFLHKQVKEAVSEYGRFAQQTMPKEMNYAGSTFAHSSSIVSDCRVRQLELSISEFN